MKPDMESHLPAARSEPTKKAHFIQWWQWILAYPQLAIAVLTLFGTSLPTFIEAIDSHRFGVPFGHSSDALEQNRLWEKNLDCAQTATLATITNSYKVEIGSKVCRSGDVLLLGKRPEWEHPLYRWVSWNELAPTNNAEEKRSALLDLFATAYAASSTSLVLIQAGPASVVCQHWVGNGLLLQRVSTPTGCFDQVINTYNGQVVSRYPAPCAPRC